MCLLEKMFLKIKKIRKVGLKESYDLVVPKNNNFFLANGVLSHNSGKSVAMKSICERYHDNPERRYKILDLWGGDRSEQLYWSIPNQDINYWMKFKKKLYFKEEGGPKQYKVRYLFPVTRNLPKKLPANTPFVNSKLFTIPIKSITSEDISLVTGLVSQAGEFLWRECLENLRPTDNGAVLEKTMLDLKGGSTVVYKNFVKPLAKELLLQSDKCSLNLDLIEEMKDRETITVLVLDFVHKEFKLFILGWILRQINTLLDSGKIRRKNIVMIREAAEFFRATDDSVMPDRYKIFRKHISHYIRMGRRGVHLFLDAQSPNETRGLVESQNDLTIFGKLSGENDRISATQQLYKDGLMTKKQIQDMTFLEPGEYYFAESGKKVQKYYLFLPRTMYWKPGYGNFYKNIWKKMVDKWTNIDVDIEVLQNEYVKTANYMKETERLDKLLENSKNTADKVNKVNKVDKSKKTKKEEEVDEMQETEEKDDNEIKNLETNLSEKAINSSKTFKKKIKLW